MESEQTQPGAEAGLEREETITDLVDPVAPQPDEAFTEAEVQAFSDKLQAWSDTLPDRERQLLATVVQSAQAGGDDVSAFSMTQLLSPLTVSLTQNMTIAQDVTVNKAKTADKAFNAMDGYVRG